jgi:hypothetical protein
MVSLAARSRVHPGSGNFRVGDFIRCRFADETFMAVDRGPSLILEFIGPYADGSVTAKLVSPDAEIVSERYFSPDEWVKIEM